MLPTAALLLLAVSVAARENSTCDGRCGIRFRQNPQGGLRVVGGQNAALGAWPWMVSLQVYTYENNRRFHACGGTLLNSHWLLTAAHCFTKKRNVYEWRLIFGARNIVFGNDQQVRPPQLERYVERIIIHERYIPALEINDIALLKITPPVQCGPYIGTGCLPHFKAGPPHVPQTCWVAGWGFLREDVHRVSPILQEARVDLISSMQCNSSYFYNGRIHATNLCAGYPEGRVDTCQGDSGGPLMCRDSVANAFVVVGVTSWGTGCGRTRRPGVYTSTWPYLNWIASKIGMNALHMIQLPLSSTSQESQPLPANYPAANPPWHFQVQQNTPSRPPGRPPLAPQRPQRPQHYTSSVTVTQPNRPTVPQHPPLTRPPIHSPPRPGGLPTIHIQSSTGRPQVRPPIRPPSSFSSMKPPQALSFAKRLQQLIENLKGKPVSSAKNYYEAEAISENVTIL